MHLRENSNAFPMIIIILFNKLHKACKLEKQSLTKIGFSSMGFLQIYIQ